MLTLPSKGQVHSKPIPISLAPDEFEVPIAGHVDRWYPDLGRPSIPKLHPYHIEFLCFERGKS